MGKIIIKILVLCILIINALPSYSQKNTLINQRPVNSKDFEILPYVSADGQVIYFCSSKKGSRNWAKYNSQTLRYDYDIYYAEKRGSSWGTPVNLGDSINTSHDEAVFSISPDGNVVYFLSFKEGWKTDGGPIYKAELRGTRWKNVEGLGGGINKFFTRKSENLSIAGGSISPDGRKFYFSTNLDPTYGKYDIWVSVLKDSSWSDPVNLGPGINAKNANNQYPYIAYDNKTLYFSSNGWGGYGKEDIFLDVSKDGTWSIPINTGSWINSKAAESSVSIPGSGDQVYLVSDRNEKNRTDIFTVYIPPEIRPSSIVLVKGKITDMNTTIPLEAKISIEDLENGSEIYSSWSNSESGQYLAVLQTGRNYSLSVEKDNYIFSSDYFMIPANSAYKEIRKDFELAPISEGAKVVVKNIFFDVGKSSLRPESIPELSRAVEFLKKYPGMIIEIAGHTDNAGTEEFNQKLSEQRAESVKHYLVSIGGIRPERLETIGYGESRPIGDNETDEGRQLNRRTEFIIKKVK